MADVFISYHEKSSGDLVKQIADTLESEGISCWYAKRDLPPGGKFADYIPKEIRSCKVFLLVLNENSNHSEHVKSETNLAFRRVNKQEQITLVPFKVDNCVLDDDVDYYLSRFNIITDGNPTDKQSIRNLTEQISHILSSEVSRAPEQEKTTESKPPEAKHKLAFFGCAICIALLLAFVIIRVWLNGDGNNDSADEDAHMESSETAILAQGDIWTLYANNLLTINAEMEDYAPAEYAPDSAAPWADYRIQIAAADISDSATRIGSYAFEHCPALVSVTIPDTVTYIGEGAFSDCTGLIDIHIPNSITDIEDGAFQGCTALKVVYIPDNVIYIGKGAFANCASLATVSVSENTGMAPDAFPNPDVIEIRQTPEPSEDGASEMELEALWDVEPEELWKIQHGQ
ncbi:MAG: leucine-rich repeat protein [Oscillibacter sp.]|nr:leucine-rich repeat protein [Oscillibacter sp.]